MADLLRGPVTVANLTAAAGALTGDDGFWWPCLNITWRTPVPATITKITAQVRERGADGRYSQPAEQVLTADELAAGEAKVVNGVSVGQHLEVRLNPEGAPGLPFQATPWLEVTTPWDAIMAETDGLTLGCVRIVCGVGEPTRTDLPISSLYVREDVSEYWRYTGGATTGTGVAVGTFTVTMSQPPTEGNLLVAMGFGYVETPIPEDGWTDVPSGHLDAYVWNPACRLAYKVAGPAESIAQTPFAVAADSARAVAVWEVSGAGWAALQDVHYERTSFSSPPVTVTAESGGANTLGLVAFFGNNNSEDPGVSIIAPGDGWTQDDAPHSLRQSIVAAHGLFDTDPVSATGDCDGAAGFVGLMVTFDAPATVSTGEEGAAGWVKMGDLTSIRLNGVEIDGHARSLNFVGDFVLSTDANHNVTVTAGAAAGVGTPTMPLTIGTIPPSLVAGGDGRLIPIVWE